MTIQQDYCRSVAHQLKRHAVWQPGSTLTVGDYGHLDGLSFLRLGHLSEFMPEQEIETQHSQPTTFEFTSLGTKVFLVHGGEPTTKNADDSTAELRITFGRSNSIYLRASGVNVSEMANVRAISEALRKKTAWNFSWTVVSGLTVANAFSLILSSTNNTEISVHGNLASLKAFDSGEALARADITVAGEVALKMMGGRGPILLDLVRLRKHLGGVRRAAQAGALAVLPYEAVLPEAPPTKQDIEA